MNTDLPPCDVSDATLARLIRRITREDPERETVRKWRRAICREHARRGRARRGQPVDASFRREAAFDTLVLEFLASYEGQVLIRLLLGGASLLADALCGSVRDLHDELARTGRVGVTSYRDEVRDTMAYAAWKAAGGTGRPPGIWPLAVSGPRLAALNAGTSPHLAGWIERLHAAQRASPAVRGAVLARLDREGRGVIGAHPTLALAHVMSGPALGVWPPPPESEPDRDLDRDPISSAAVPTPGVRR